LLLLPDGLKTNKYGRELREFSRIYLQKFAREAFVEFAAMSFGFTSI
jgi:hypothetical protein